MTHIHEILPNAPLDELFPIDSYEYVRLSNIARLFDQEFLLQLKHQSKTDRINVFNPDIKSLVGQFKEPFADTYSWYVFIKTPPQRNISQKDSIKNELIVEKLHHTSLRTQDQDELINYWTQQYVENIQQARSRAQKIDIAASLLDTLGEGTHFLYRKNGRLVGHGAYVEDSNEVLLLHNHYVHLWTNQLEPIDTRRAVLKHFFAHLNNSKLALTAGIAVNNKKSLRVFSNNAFEPAMLSIGVYR